MAVDKGVTERIKLLVDRHKGGNVAQFAQSINVTRSSMSKIYRGEVNPSLSTLQEILKVYPEVDGDWLLCGNEKEMVHERHIETSKVNDPEYSYGDKNLIELIREQFQVKDEQIARLIEKMK